MATLASLAQGAGPLAEGMLDVRGWEIRTLIDDAAVGSVDDLLLDEGGLVRWLEVSVTGAGQVLVPAGQGRADERHRRIWLPGLTAEQIANLPTHEHEVDPPDDARQAELLAAYAAVLLREPVREPVREPLTAGERPAAAAVAPMANARLDPRGLFPREAL